jgi:hypothetical protein
MKKKGKWPWIFLDWACRHAMAPAIFVAPAMHVTYPKLTYPI